MGEIYFFYANLLENLAGLSLSDGTYQVKRVPPMIKNFMSM